jgi:capsid protein
MTKDATDREMSDTQTDAGRDPRVNRLERRLLEAFDELWNGFVDPSDVLYDADGAKWNPVGDGALGSAAGAAFANEQQLASIRAQCRALAVGNEFAINGHENRVSYIVGSGHTYRVAAKTGREAPEELLRSVQAVLDEFARVNKWHKRQQEIVRRRDRDGECFLRFFATADGMTLVRFIEPGQVSTPAALTNDPSASFGIKTDPRDVETVVAYFIDGSPVDADDIQHRKANVDANVKRGLPLFYPVMKNLRRAEKLLRNMSVVSEIQSAIAIIRKHRGATVAGLEQFVQNQADLNLPNQAAGRTSYFKRYAPGTILDALAGTEYEFPAAGIDAGRYVTVLQAELRAIASRLVMPEFMLSSDASNANYSSTMVAEGPAVKMFDRLQNDMMEDDLEVMRRAVDNAAAAGRLPLEAISSVDIQAVAPTLAAHDRLKDAQADQILYRNGAMSADTLAMRHGLDPERERQLLRLSQ